MQLPETDRIEIAHRLLESLPGDENGPAIDDPAFLAEFDRRFDDDTADLTLEEFRASRKRP